MRQYASSRKVDRVSVGISCCQGSAAGYTGERRASRSYCSKQRCPLFSGALKQRGLCEYLSVSHFIQEQRTVQRIREKLCLRMSSEHTPLPLVRSTTDPAPGPSGTVPRPPPPPPPPTLPPSSGTLKNLIREVLREDPSLISTTVDTGRSRTTDGKHTTNILV